MNQISLQLGRVALQQQNALGSLSLASKLLSGGHSRPPWVDPPDNALPFDPPGVINTPIIGNNAILVQILVPDGYDGVIKRFSCNVNAPFVEGSGDLIWRMTVDGKPVRNYDNMLVQMGTPANPRVTDGIRIFSGQVVAITEFNIAYAALATQSYGFLSGYYYPKPKEGRTGRAA